MAEESVESEQEVVSQEPEAEVPVEIDEPVYQAITCPDGTVFECDAREADCFDGSVAYCPEVATTPVVLTTAEEVQQEVQEEVEETLELEPEIEEVEEVEEVEENWDSEPVVLVTAEDEPKELTESLPPLIYCAIDDSYRQCGSDEL